MATISGNGGAERYWRHADGRRLVLCRNGVVMVQDSGGGRWRDFVGSSGRWAMNMPEVAGWRADAGQAARAAVTRTGRQARRREDS